MLILNEILVEIGESVVNQLRNDIKNKSLVAGYPPPDASGKLYDNINYTVDNGVLKVFALDYIYYLEKGRKAGKRPPRNVIRKWIDDKGIPAPKSYLAKYILKSGTVVTKEREYKNEEAAKDSLAYMIQRAIGNKGTLIAQQGGSDLLSSIITDNFIADMRQKIGFNIINAIRSEVLNIAA